MSLTERLKEYFSSRKEVAFAFLYGSQAKGNATKLSDVDIAVYFYPENRHPIEYEEETVYPTEGELWNDLERILNKEVELLGEIGWGNWGRVPILGVGFRFPARNTESGGRSLMNPTRSHYRISTKKGIDSLPIASSPSK